MKTSELIDALAAVDSEAVRPTIPSRRLIPAATAGTILAVAVLAWSLGFQPLGPALRAPWFWMKAGYCLALALAGFLLLARLARPGARLGVAGIVVGVLGLAGIGMMAAHASMHAPAAVRPSLWLGETWRVCPWRILALSAPIYLALVLGLRRLAPTRLALAGGAAGLLAGGLAGAIYGLYCREYAAPFVAAWYSAGMAACMFLGAALGRRLLRW